MPTIVLYLVNRHLPSKDNKFIVWGLIVEAKRGHSLIPFEYPFQRPIMLYTITYPRRQLGAMEIIIYWSTILVALRAGCQRDVRKYQSSLLSHVAYSPKTKLSGRKIWPNGPERTESIVPGSRSTRTALGTYFPPANWEKNSKSTSKQQQNCFFHRQLNSNNTWNDWFDSLVLWWT